MCKKLKGYPIKQFLILTLLFSLTNTFVYSQSSADTNKALVIFYRTNMWGGAYSYKLMQGDSTLTEIKYKFFYPIKLDEGTYTYWATNAGGKDEITLILKAGHNYLIKCETGFSLPVRKPKMILLTDKEAKKELNGKYLKEKIAEYNLKL